MNIRKAVLKDLREVQDIGARSYLPHYAHLWKIGGAQWYLNRCFAVDILEQELTDENIEYYLVAADAQNIGLMKLVLRKPVPDSEIANALYLEKLYFVGEWTGRGAGQELFNLAFRRASELGRECVWLMAMDTSEKPIAAYEKKGFTIYARTRLDFELMKEEFRGMVVMKNCEIKNGN